MHLVEIVTHVLNFDLFFGSICSMILSCDPGQQQRAAPRQTCDHKGEQLILYRTLCCQQFWILYSVFLYLILCTKHSSVYSASGEKKRKAITLAMNSR